MRLVILGVIAVLAACVDIEGAEAVANKSGSGWSKTNVGKTTTSSVVADFDGQPLCVCPLE